MAFLSKGIFQKNLLMVVWISTLDRIAEKWEIDIKPNFNVVNAERKYEL